MAGKKSIDEAALARFWTEGMALAAIAKRLDCHENTISNRIDHLGLPRRAIGGRRNPATERKLPPRKFVLVPVPPKKRSAAVTITAPTIEDRKDWPDLLAAIARAKGSKMPVKAVNIIAANFRLSPSVVQGLIHAATIAPPAAIRADVKQRRGQE